MRPGPHSIPPEDVFQAFTNTDAVHAFVERDWDFEPGEWFDLPDISQRYTIEDVRFYKVKRGPRKINLLHLNFRAECAIPGCPNTFVFFSPITRLRQSRPYLQRCCPDHTRQWSTPFANAWVTAAELQERSEAAPKIKPQAVKDAVRGTIQHIVTTMVEGFSVSFDEVPLPAFVDACVAKIPPPEDRNKRDTRRQVVVRAMYNLKRERDARFNIENGKVCFLP